ncbi:MAG: NUDIX domain-containing protein [Candidatus Woesearchaeota archaeon]
MAEKVKLLPVVNEKDKIVGYKKRNQLKSNDIYRVAGLWVTSETGEILLARRALSKKHDPGLWGPAVAGTAEKGESYSTNIKKEAKEELGIEGLRFAKGKKQRFYGTRNYFCQWYSLKLNNDYKFRINKKEVQEIQWIMKDKLLAEIRHKPRNYLSNMATIEPVAQGL